MSRPQRSTGGPQRGAGGKRSTGGAQRSTGGGAPRSTGGASRTASGTKRSAGRPSAPATRRFTPDRPVPTHDPVDVHDPAGIRLQKLLAAAGVGSRRACENLISQGRVEVDGHVVTELGVRIDPATQSVRVDGVRVQVDQGKVYLALNKPRGVVSTMSDEHGRPCLGDYVARRSERLFHVGRLDAETEGLILLTNDGELAHRLSHPSYEVAKTYVATIPGPVPRDLGRALREGIELEDGPVQVDSFRVVDSAPGKALVEIILHEGRNHVVRRLFDEVGFPVQSLTRTAVGPVRLGDLRTGRQRLLGGREIGQLFAAVGL